MSDEPETVRTEAEPEAAEPAAEGEPAGGQPGPKRDVTLSMPVFAGLAGVLAIVLAAAVVFGLLLLGESREDSARESALEAARSLAVSVTSYDYRNMDQNVEDVLDGATGEFRDEYLGASESLRAIIKEAKATAEGKVLQAAVLSADEDRAQVLLFVDQSVTNAAAKKPRVDDNRVLMSLEWHDNRWLVSKLELL